MRPRVKICCIASVDEARLAIDAGAAALGFVSRMPSGPGVIPEERIAEIVPRIPSSIGTFLLTCEHAAGQIIAQHRRCGTNTIQLCDRVPDGTHAIVREALPGVSLVQVIHVAGEESVDEAVAVSPYVDAILLDSGNQNLPVRELGGTGRVHDWAVSRRVRQRVATPVFLAGGLRAENVRAAIDAVQPYAVDVCSGVRTEGRLDPVKLHRFFSALAA